MTDAGAAAVAEARATACAAGVPEATVRPDLEGLTAGGVRESRVLTLANFDEREGIPEKP